jgi:lipid-A-disaccharide synthase
MRIGMVAGELSGDLLGSGLIQALRTNHPHAIIEGIGGNRMIANGFHSHYPLETLAVMGLVEVIKYFPRLKSCREQLCTYFSQHPPDVFIGIDAPDFNLGLEYALKTAGIPTVHYVSPSVWAWRHYRLHKIARSCDLMLTLFPFEADYYQQHAIPVHCVGHPLADQIPFQTDQQLARQQLNLPSAKKWVTILPGSRRQEVLQLGIPFLQTAQWLLTHEPQLRFLVPLASHSLKELFCQQLAQVAPNLPITLLLGQSHEAMIAGDVILTASGTATLEAMLFKRPMVVAYRLTTITYWLARWLVHIPYFSLPNLLTQQQLVAEFLQNQVTPENLGTALLYWLENPQAVEILQNQFTQLHHQLRLDANHQAAQSILAIATKAN